MAIKTKDRKPLETKTVKKVSANPAKITPDATEKKARLIAPKRVKSIAEGKTSLVPHLSKLAESPSPRASGVAPGNAPGLSQPRRQKPKRAGTPVPGRDQPTVSNVVADSVVSVRKALGVTQDVFARMLGVSTRAVAGWEAGKQVTQASQRRIQEMKRLASSLRDVMRPDFVPQWLTSPNEALGGHSPIHALERGETDRLWRTVFLLGSGLPV